MGERLRPSGRDTTSTGFTRLLARLGSEPAQAAREYERLRFTLEKFFDWRGAWPPEECADETLDRLVVKLEGETEIADLWSYARGIARLVLLEWQRRPAPVPIGDSELPDRVAAPDPPSGDEPLRACFDRCLSELPADGRTLVLDYYEAERRDRIVNRRQLARRLGVSESALRNRVQRVRDRLERCVLKCRNAHEGSLDDA